MAFLRCPNSNRSTPDIYQFLPLAKLVLVLRKVSLSLSMRFILRLKYFHFGAVIIIANILIFSCKKEQDPPSTDGAVTYSTLQDFYFKNGVKKETFTIDAVNGGTFVSVKGTKVNIPANAFKDTTGNFINGPINFDFKDIYKKSDMLLSAMPTNCIYGAMKSGGEFYLKANYNNIFISNTKTLTISQPLTEAPHPNMQSLIIWRPDTAKYVMWDGTCGSFSCNTGLVYSAPNYLYYIYSGYFTSGSASPKWFNTDDPWYFSSYPQSTLTIINPEQTLKPDVFMIFKTVNSVVQIYNTNGYSYSFAPIGLQATIVSAAIKDGKLFTSFVPITISANQTVTLNFKLTRTEDFVSALRALD